MWTSLRNRFLWVSAALLLSASLRAASNSIGTVDVQLQATNPFTAGVSTNTAGSGGMWVSVFTSTNGIPAAGQTVYLQLMKGGTVLPNAMTPTSFQTDGIDTTYGPAGLGSLQITYFTADTGLTMRASTAPAAGVAATDVSSAFSVNPGAAMQLVVLADGVTNAAGQNPPVGPTGTATAQQPNQPFDVTVILADTWFNKVSGSHVVHFAPAPLMTVPADGPLTAGQGIFQVTINSARTSRTLSVSDVTSPGIAPGSLNVTTSGPQPEEVFPFPSPFNPAAGQPITFRFLLNSPKTVTLLVKDRFSQDVWHTDRDGATGTTDVAWDGHNDKGQLVAAGVYQVLLEIDGKVASRKRFGVVK